MSVAISSTNPVTGNFPDDELRFSGTLAELRGSLVVADVPEPAVAAQWVTRSVLIGQIIDAVQDASYRVVSVADAQAMAQADTAIQPAFYRIARGADANGRRGDVVVQGIAFSPATNANEGDIPARFASVGLWLNPATGQWVQAFYDVATDTVTPAQLTAAEIAQLSIAAAAVKATTLGEPARGYETLEAAVADIRARFGGTLDTWTFTIQRNLLVTGAVDLDDAYALVSNQVGLTVAAGASLRIGPPCQVNGLYLFSYAASQGQPAGRLEVASLRIHNSFIGGQPLTPLLLSEDTLLTDSTTGRLRITGTLRLGPGSTLDLSTFTRNPDGTYTTPDGGTVVDERGGAPGATLDIYARDTQTEANRISALFTSPGQVYAFDPTLTAPYPIHSIVTNYNTSEVYTLRPNRNDPDVDGNAKPYWWRSF